VPSPAARAKIISPHTAGLPVASPAPSRPRRRSPPTLRARRAGRRQRARNRYGQQAGSPAWPALEGRWRGRGRAADPHRRLHADPRRAAQASGVRRGLHLHLQAARWAARAPWDPTAWNDDKDWEFTSAAGDTPEQLYALWTARRTVPRQACHGPGRGRARPSPCCRHGPIPVSSGRINRHRLHRRDRLRHAEWQPARAAGTSDDLVDV
jgi:hypothetical protein